MIALLFCGAFITKAQQPSMTLPVMYINTENGQEITSREDYINATYYLESNSEEFESFGSPSEPLPLEIRGRGNWTWEGFDKKPYKIKLGKKTALLGMNKSKHFALLAHADDELGFLRNTAGFELSRRLGLPWTPGQQPVELVLNGDYKGLYFLTENIRVEETRVNIVEQADNIDDPEAIKGGWLVEIDNYDKDPHITVAEGNGAIIWFTYKTPEVLSAKQEQYLQDEMEKVDRAIYSTNKNSTLWEEYVDLDQLIRFYIVQEILDNAESFHGSCFLYKDLDETKWKFGPVWDFGNTYRRYDQMFIYERPPYGQIWIAEMAKFPHFQERLKKVWEEFLGYGYDGLEKYLSEFVEGVQTAARSDANRWPIYGNQNIIKDYNTFIEKLHNRITWLGRQWGATIDFGETPQPSPDPNPEGKTIYLRGYFNGWGLDNPFEKKKDGLYYITNISFEDAFKIADSEWGEINLGSNGSPIYVGEKYILVRGTNENIIPAQKFENVDFVVDLNEPSVTIRPTGTVGIDAVTKEEIAVTGREIRADGRIVVYDFRGIKLQEGRDRLRIEGTGPRIIVTERGSLKHTF